MARRDDREPRLVVVTDRAVLPETHEREEWKLAVPLQCIRFPVGFGGIGRDLMVVTQNPSYAYPLQQVGIAATLLMDLRGTYGADLDLSNPHAREAEARRSEAVQALLDAVDKKRFPQLLARYALKLLAPTTHLQQVIGQSWEIQILKAAACGLMATLAVEDDLLRTLYGRPSRSNDLVRQDRRRARSSLQDIVSRTQVVWANQPQPAVAQVLSERYLDTVLPHLHSQRIPPIDLAAIRPVTASSGRVTPSSPDCGHGTRSPVPISGLAQPA